MPCPDAHRLAEDLTACRAAGVDSLFSMLPAAEADDLGLSGEAASCAAAGLEFHRQGVADFGLPEVGAFDGLVGQISDMLATGRGVAVHCRAGIGRSGMVVCCVLVAQGQSAAAAVRSVSCARGVAVPDTVEQRRFIAEFEKRHRDL